VKARGDAHPLLVALMRHLPPPGTPWSSDRRRRWLAALDASVRLIYDVVPELPTRHPIYPVEPPY
jgi:hypothetical protein